MFPTSYVRFVSLILFGLTMALGGCEHTVPAGSSFDEVPFVAVTQIVEHPAWNAVRDGIKDELAATGYVAGDNLRWEWLSAQNNPATAARIADKYASASPDVIVAIAPLSARSTAAVTRRTPIIFSAVSDPVGIQLVKNTDKPGKNVSGVRDLTSVDRQLALIKEILPEASALGVIYSADSLHIEADLIKAQASLQGFTDVRAVEVFSPAEVQGAARSLVGAVDAFYVPQDKTGSTLEEVLQVGKAEQVPVFSSDIEAAQQGAIASFSFSYYDIGRQTGAMVAKVLEGSRPEDIPVEFADVEQLSVNRAAAAAMGVVIPWAVVERADRVYE